jgi:hypothetical protein
MPQGTKRSGKSLFHMLFLTAALSLLSAVVRRERKQLIMSTKARKKKVGVAPRRVAASLAFATLFFAGAALSAGAGNTVTKLFDQGSDSALVEESTSTETATTEDPTVAPADPAADEAEAEALEDAPDPGPSDPEPAPASADPALAPEAQVSAPASNTQAAGVQAALSQRARVGMAPKPSPTGSAVGKVKAKSRAWAPKSFLRQKPVVKSDPGPLRAPVDREAEADEPNVDATVWLYRALPDPTPPSRRLKPAFARKLKRISARNNVDWALTLAVLRASGERGSFPASAARLRALTKALHTRKARKSPWTSVLSLEGRTAFADRSVALMHLYRAMGLKALVKGFDWAKPSLSKRILNDKRISIYPGGRTDILHGRVNVRVLAMIAYLAEAHGQVTVSCLISGHRLYARPGVISAHIYGLAADISMLAGTSILGHQQQHSVTEKAVRNILLLPAELQPRQVISLIGMGGPSFPLSNHDDHIHVGY